MSLKKRIDKPFFYPLKPSHCSRLPECLPSPGDNNGTLRNSGFRVELIVDAILYAVFRQLVRHKGAILLI